MKAVTLSALLLIASLFQANARPRLENFAVRSPCLANVCIINNKPVCIVNLFGPTTAFGEPLHCWCPIPAGMVWGYMEYRRLQCAPLPN
jgi:hypothetical protein